MASAKKKRRHRKKHSTAGKTHRKRAHKAASTAAPKHAPKKRKRHAAPLQVGDHVKLSFKPEPPIPGGPTTEAMWVRVTGKGKGVARYRGVLDDSPYFIRGIQRGARLEFARQDVLKVHRAGTPWQSGPGGSTLAMRKSGQQTIYV